MDRDATKSIEKLPFLGAEEEGSVTNAPLDKTIQERYGWQQCSCQSLSSRVVKACSIFVLMGLSSLVTYYCTIRLHSHPLGSYHNGFTTEFESVKPSFRLDTQTPSGNVLFGQQGVYFPNDSLAIQYSGTGPEVDKIWEDASLHHRHWFLITDEEAEEAWGPTYTQYWNELRGGYYATLDVYHTIHCLDTARRAVHRDYYEGDKQMGGAHHIDHCIALVLQSLQCKADATLIPTTYRDTIGKNYLMPERPHTCRDLSKINEYVLRRVPGGDLEVPPRERGPKDGVPEDTSYLDSK